MPERCRSAADIISAHHPGILSAAIANQVDVPWSHVPINTVPAPPQCGRLQHNAGCVSVDRFTKMVHYAPCWDGLSAQQLVDLLLRNALWVHACPVRIISYCRCMFTAAFWREVAAVLGPMPLGFSTAVHTQSDGQTERSHCVPGTTFALCTCVWP